MDTVSECAISRGPWALALLDRLVAEHSTESNPAAVDRCFTIVGEAVSPLANASIEYPENEGLRSLVARFGRASTEVTLTFLGHIDVVPIEGTCSAAPFTLTEQDGRLYGRGVCDMKGAVAAFAAALWAVAEAGILESCSIELALTGDEEVGSRRGTIPLLERGLIRGQHAVCGEPTALVVFVGNRGLVWLEIELRGRGGHAGVVHRLANPIPVAATLVSALESMPLRTHDPRFDPPTPSIAVTKLVAGAALTPNVIPDHVVVVVDRRLLPGENPKAVIAEIEDVVAEVVDHPFTASVTPRRVWPPYVIAEEEAVVQRALGALRAAGLPEKVGVDLAADDSSWLATHGIPSVLVGPGSPEDAHAPNESLSIRQLEDAIVVYAHLIAGTREDGL